MPNLFILRNVRNNFFYINYKSQTSFYGFKSNEFRLVSVIERATERKFLFKKGGIYWPAPVFSHSHLYVTQNRTRKKKNVKILLKERDGYGMLVADRFFTKNTVIKSLLN